MASYFDEHNCEPLQQGQRGDDFLHLARLLLDSGLAVEFDMSFNSIFGTEKPPPPTSRKFIDNLKSRLVREESPDDKCTICLKMYEEAEVVKELPCKHEFHDTCIIPWLNKTNSCPVCRFELPTDDPDYEEYRRQVKRSKQREVDLQKLHDSMFS